MASRRLFLTGGAAVAGATSVFGALPRPAFAQDEPTGRLKEILDRGTVIVGTGSATPPWHFEDESGTLTGMDVEVARILAKGLFGDTEKVEFVVQAADARVPNLLANKVDIVIQFMSITAARAQLVDFTESYYREAITVLLLKDSPYNTLADMAGKGITVSALQNPHIEDVAHEGIPDAVVEQFDSVANTALALDAGRGDAMLAAFSTAQWLTAPNPDKYKYPPESWAIHNYGAAVAPGDAHWLSFVNQVFIDMMTGLEFALYHDAFLKYFGIDLVKPPAGAPLLLTTH